MEDDNDQAVEACTWASRQTSSLFTTGFSYNGFEQFGKALCFGNFP